MNVPRASRLAALASLALSPLVFCACGSGGDGWAAFVNGEPTAVLTTPASPASGDVTLDYTLTDPEGDAVSVVVEFSLDGGGSYAPASAAAGGDGTAGLSSSASPGTAHAFVWDGVADGVGIDGPATTVRLRITPSDAIETGTPGETADFTVDNAASTPPVVTSITTPFGTQSGLVVLSYVLSDAESDPCGLVVEYSFDGTDFFPAEAGPGPDGSGGLGASPGGTAHAFVWNTMADTLAFSSPKSLRVRITPSDSETGTPATTDAFTLDNTALSGGGLVSADWPVVEDPVPGGDLDAATALATDGAWLYVGGLETAGAEDSAWRIEKRDARTGVLVASFGVGGAVTENVAAGLDAVTSMQVLGDALYVIGVVDTSPFDASDPSVRLEKRSTADGSLVAGFGEGGVLVWSGMRSPEGSHSYPRLALDQEGAALILSFTEAVDEVVQAGADAVEDTQFHLERRSLSDGVLDKAFGAGGVIEQNVNDLQDGINAIVVDGAFLYVAGFQDDAQPLVGGGAALRIEKRSKTTGAFVATFGTSAPGIVRHDPSGGHDFAHDLVVDTATTADSVFTLATSDGTWFLEKRSVETGALGASASLGLPAVGGPPRPGSIALGAPGTGRLYVALAQADGDRQWRIEQRLEFHLGLSGPFGSSGVVTSSPTTDGDDPFAVLVSGGVVFIAGQDRGGPSATARWRIEARFVGLSDR